MAKKPSVKKSSARKAATRDLETRLIESLLELSARDGWESVTLPAIAEHAGASLSELYPNWRSRITVLAAFNRRIDREVVETEFSFSPEDSIRDRLFEVLMRRFDALQPHREAIHRIRSGVMRDPAASAAMMRQMACSMAWMLQAAGLSSDGIAGKIKIAGLIGIWMRTISVWVDDESEDMARTMAELDRALKRADRWADALFCRKRHRSGESMEAA